MRIVETLEPAWSEAARWELSSEPAIELGVVAGAAQEQFHQVTDVVRVRDGRIVVANAGSGEIRIFDAEGRFVRAFGGEGDGPGEVRFVQSVHVVEDTLLAYDSGLQRVTRFDLDGRLLRTAQVDDRVSVANRFDPNPVWLGSRRFLLFGRLETPEGMNTRRRPPVALLRFTTDGTLLDAVAVLPGLEVASWEVDGQRLVGTTVPFSRRPVVAAGPDRVYLGTQQRREVGVYDPSGALRQHIRWRGPSLGIDADDHERWERAYLERSIQPEESKRRMLRMVDPAPLPDRRPAYWHLRVDATGHLWVAEYGPCIPGLTPTRWRVFDPEGRLLGAVAVPDRFRVHQVGEDFVLGVRRGASNVEYVSLYRLRKPGA